MVNKMRLSKTRDKERRTNDIIKLFVFLVYILLTFYMRYENTWTERDRERILMSLVS